MATQIEKSAKSSGGTKNLGFSIYTALVGLMIPLGLYLAFVYAPIENVLGIVQKIFYFHLPSVFAMYMAGLICGVTSAIYLFKRDDKWDAIAVSSAEVTALFGTMMLVSGSIWARKSWGYWWSFEEPRLTAALLFWLIFVAYLALRSFGSSGTAERRIAAAMATFGILLIPVIRYATQKFGGEHPVLGELDDQMRIALRVNIAVMLNLAIVLMWFRTRIERSRQRIWVAEERLAEEGLLEDQ